MSCLRSRRGIDARAGIDVVEIYISRVISTHSLIEIGTRVNLDEMTVTAELAPEGRHPIRGKQREELVKQRISIGVLPAEPMKLERSAGTACRVIDGRKNRSMTR